MPKEISVEKEAIIVGRAAALIEQLKAERFSPHEVVCILPTASCSMITSSLSPRGACEDFCESIKRTMELVIPPAH